ncbi:carboxypeptidase-like regulatory domain-containing protein [uncultured Chitinophaga sp.]|jgi:hypothetical protein|uniref:carboxypeptidase-like regulatory domain-containing protein n=1 Tax=uncultured Chitinophaga sp. TaxID=339340 RepID=UPI002632AD92|nr:carboxypeptidase-like regulatory domain-containing protein [uncultured Chitinophaga sp.]
MKLIRYLVCLIVFTACNPVKQITGSKPDGSGYVLSIQPSANKKDSVFIQGNIRAVDTDSTEYNALIALQLIKLDTSGYKASIGPDPKGRFSCMVLPGRYYLSIAALGFGKIKTAEFTVKKGQSVSLEAVMHPVAEQVSNDPVLTPYKTVPRRPPANQPSY